MAGGVESMSRWGVAVGAPTIDGGNPDLRARFPTVPQGISADLIATLEGFTREDLDAFATESQRRAAVAMAEGRFERGIVAVTDPAGATLLDHDEHPRPSTTLEGLAKLRPAFEEMGTFSAKDETLTFDELCLQRYRGRRPHRARAPRRELLGGGRRCGHRGGGLRQLGRGQRGHSPRPHQGDGGHRLRAGHHVDRPGPGGRSAVWPRPAWRSATSTCGRSTRPSPSCR